MDSGIYGETSICSASAHRTSPDSYLSLYYHVHRAEETEIDFGSRLGSVGCPYLEGTWHCPYRCNDRCSSGAAPYRPWYSQANASDDAVQCSYHYSCRWRCHLLSSYSSAAC